MSFNIFLAVIPVVLGWVFFNFRQKKLRYATAIIWLLFLPNAIYLFTDIINLIWQWGRVGDSERLVLLFQYFVLEIFGFVTFILALYPFEKFISSCKWMRIRKHTILLIIILNFIIAFGVTLGRVERVNSWDVLAAPINVVNASLNILFSVELIVLTILFGLFGNFLYFAFRKPLIRYFSTYSNLIGASR